MSHFPMLDLLDSRSGQLVEQFSSVDGKSLGAGTPDRVRVTRGALAGLIGRVISKSDPDRWLIATEQQGLLLRIGPHMLESVPTA